MRLIPIGVLTLLTLTLVGATLVVAWPMIMIGALLVALSKGTDMWSDRRRAREQR